MSGFGKRATRTFSFRSFLSSLSATASIEAYKSLPSSSALMTPFLVYTETVVFVESPPS